MEIGAFRTFPEGDAGTIAFNHLAAESFEQRFDAAPFQGFGNRCGKNSSQDFSMRVVYQS